MAKFREISYNDSVLRYIVHWIMPVAYGLLPQSMGSVESKAMLVAIALQESRFEHRFQVINAPGVKGPARGFWQFEKGGGVRGVRGWIFKNPQSKAYAEDALAKLGYKSASEDERYTAIEHNDVLACLFARCLLWTLPQALPQEGEREKAWEQYIDGWRPGKPHRATWDDCYDLAWEVVK